VIEARVDEYDGSVWVDDDGTMTVEVHMHDA
jgi:hypothetical protein